METYYVTETRGWATYSELCMGQQWNMPWVQDYDLSRAVHPRAKEEREMQPPGSAEGFSWIVVKVLNSHPPEVLLWFPPFFFFFKDFCFWCGSILKSLLNVTILHLLSVLVFWPQGMWDLNSLARDFTCTLCIARWGLNHWTTWEVPAILMLPEFFS